MNESKDLLQPLEGGSFTFACHKGVSCFTECCRDLNLILTPYDVLRLKHRLGMSSSEFLAAHTHTRERAAGPLPLLFLSMRDDERKTCPFVTADGCRIYEDRPGACRTYPLGRAAAKAKGQKETSEKYFVVREDHCLGFREDCSWTVQTWLEHEGLESYNRRNDDWTEIVTRLAAVPAGSLGEKRLTMFHLASYDLDGFRRFVFDSTFLRRFAVTEEDTERMRQDDEALLDFSLRWIRFFLLGDLSLTMAGG